MALDGDRGDVVVLEPRGVVIVPEEDGAGLIGLPTPGLLCELGLLGVLPKGRLPGLDTPEGAADPAPLASIDVTLFDPSCVLCRTVTFCPIWSWDRATDWPSRIAIADGAIVKLTTRPFGSANCIVRVSRSIMRIVPLIIERMSVPIPVAADIPPPAVAEWLAGTLAGLEEALRDTAPAEAPVVAPVAGR